MPTSILTRLLSFGLAAFGLNPTPAEPEPNAEAPEVVMVAEPGADALSDFGDSPSEPAVAASSEGIAGSRIDPALLNNPTLRRALAMVGPDLLADPEVREAIRTGRFDQSLLSNPTVSRAMIRVTPMVLADPQLSAALRSGELDASMLRDPAVMGILRSMDPTLFTRDEEPEAPSRVATPSVPVVPAPTPVVPTPMDDGLAIEETSSADEDLRAERRRARAEARAERRQARRAGRGSVEPPRIVLPELQEADRERAERVVGHLIGIAFDLLDTAPRR